MKASLLVTAACLVVSSFSPAWADGVVTIYSVDGLHDGEPSWLGKQFEAFTKETGVKVQYVEAGSSGVVDRVAKERANTQADVLMTYPPFIQKAAADGLLQAYTPKDTDKLGDHDRDPNGMFVAVVNNYPNFIYNAEVLKAAPKTYEDLLDPKYKRKVQYSTPGQAGDGTAFMLQTFRSFGGKDQAFDFLQKLQANNLGPSASTGKLTALVNKGEIYIANGDMQMNLAQSASNPNIRIFFPAGPDGKKSVFPIPYFIGLVKGAPEAENGKKLIDYLISKKAQEDVSTIAMGLPVRTDVSPTDDNFKKLQAMLEGVEIWAPDWEKVLGELKEDVARYKEVTVSN
jgi:2-aminoethylphosphonate transport system substrate-binding protein